MVYSIKFILLGCVCKGLLIITVHTRSDYGSLYSCACLNVEKCVNAVGLYSHCFES